MNATIQPMTAEELLDDLKVAMAEVRDIKAGKKEAASWEELLK